ncbi:hypothetical protein AB205_0108000 [Aquarana catesbeiana]|uniref:Uncharacterized protein n=2 Tax=Aquarana catesbeiana TaxID=8400 RepID=A0A2G9QFK2_AQUCT|nr:hypothetical protein AB205_0108000 [Aquarana catesbeiana]
MDQWYQTGQQAVDQWYQTGQKVMDQWYQTGQRVIGQWYQTGEQAVDQWYQTGQQVMDQWYQTGQQESEENICSVVSARAKMEKDRNKILSITLEILYLLTGEDYVVVKKSGEDQISAQITITGPPLSLMSSERSRDKKILELINKIIDLLKGEEWEHLEGHKDLYKDVMMENQPPHTSPDGSSNGNPSERSHHPLYSWDSPWEDHNYVHHDQGEERKAIKTETEEEEKILDSRDQYSTEKCIPLYSQNFTQEVPSISHQIQNEELKDIKAEIKVEEEETLVSGDQQSMEEGEMIMESKQEESSLHMDTSKS